MNQMEQAIQDLKYARSLGETAFNQHIDIWSIVGLQDQDDIDYADAIKEIKQKLGTDKCLLKEQK